MRYKFNKGDLVRVISLAKHGEFYLPEDYMLDQIYKIWGHDYNVNSSRPYDLADPEYILDRPAGCWAFGYQLELVFSA